MKIEWTLLAKSDYWQNIEYLEENWAESDIVNFIKKVDNSLFLLKSKTILFVKSDYKDVCKMVITKQITLFYLIDSETIYLLRFWNNYQDPTTLKLK